MKKHAGGRPPLPPRDRIELQLDRRIATKARVLAKRSGCSTFQEWLKLVVSRAVQDAELYR